MENLMRWRDDRRGVQWDRNALVWGALGFALGLISCGILRFVWPAFFR